MTASPLSPARRRSITLSVGGLVLLGAVGIGRVLLSENSGRLDWIPPLALWGFAFLSWQRYLKPKA